MDTTTLIRILAGLLLVVLCVLYFYPTFKAMGKRNTGAIFAVNLLTGWCAIGWFVALIWALKNDVVALRPDEVQQYAGRDRRIKVCIYILWSIVAIILAVAMILTTLYSASQPKTLQSLAEFFATKPSAIDIVRNGYSQGDQTTTVGKNLEHTFQNGKWTSFTTETGVTIVEFDGTIPFSQYRAANPQLWQINCESNPSCHFINNKLKSDCQQPPEDAPQDVVNQFNTCMTKAYELNDNYPIEIGTQFSINHDGTFQYYADNSGPGIRSMETTTGQSSPQQSTATDQPSSQQSTAADQSDQQQSPEQSSPIGEAAPIPSPQPNASPLDITPRGVQDPVESKRLNTEGLHALSGANPDLASARNDFERSFQLDTTSVEALNNLGYVYGRLGDYQTAEPILVKVLEMSPTRKAAQGNLGAVQAELGKTKDAADHFCQYIRHFDSLEQGKSTLSRVFKDADSNVKAAIDLTLANCN